MYEGAACQENAQVSIGVVQKKLRIKQLFHWAFSSIYVQMTFIKRLLEEWAVYCLILSTNSGGREVKVTRMYPTACQK